MQEHAETRITITGLDPDVKRDLVVVAAQEGTSVSEIIRDRLPRIIQEVTGDLPSYDELAASEALAESRLAMLETVVELYQRRHYSEAEAQLAKYRNL